MNAEKGENPLAIVQDGSLTIKEDVFKTIVAAFFTVAVNITGDWKGLHIT